MSDKQYWDCDHCDERYPLSGYTQYEWEEVDGEVYWLCCFCYDVARQFNDEPNSQLKSYRFRIRRSGATYRFQIQIKKETDISGA